MARLFIATFLILIASVASAETRMVNSPGDGYLNLREGPSSNYPIIIEMYHGQTAEILSKSANWLEVRHQSGAVGWAYGKTLIPFSSAKSQLRVNSPNDGYLNLRSGPSSKHKILRQMTHGSKTTVVTRSGEWLKVRHDSGTTGWAHSKYLNTAIAARNTAPKKSPSTRSTSNSSSKPSGGGLLGAMLRGGIKAIENAGSSSGGYKVSRSDAQINALEWCKSYWLKGLVDHGYSHCVIDYCSEYNGSWNCDADPKR